MEKYQFYNFYGIIEFLDIFKGSVDNLIHLYEFYAEIYVSKEEKCSLDTLLDFKYF